MLKPFEPVGVIREEAVRNILCEALFSQIEAHRSQSCNIAAVGVKHTSLTLPAAIRKIENIAVEV